METPSAARSETIRCTSAFAATSIPRVGSSRIRIRGRVASHFAITTFCWLPPDKSFTTCSRVAMRMRSEETYESVSSSSFLRPRKARKRRRARWTASVRFSRTFMGRTRACTLRSSGR